MLVKSVVSQGNILSIKHYLIALTENFIIRKMKLLLHVIFFIIVLVNTI